MPYQLTKAAANDLHGIWLYSFEKWGEQQADSYLHGLEKAFLEIASNPEIGLTKYQLHKNIKVYRYRRHYIFYLSNNTKVIIIAVFHEKMNAVKRIGTRSLS